MRIEESLDVDHGRDIEYGIFQLETIPGTPLWRRHTANGKGRFLTLRNALFAKQGARASCLGSAPYPKTRYSATGRLVVPYVATWLAGSNVACLIRSVTPDPEITLVPSNRLANLSPDNMAELTSFLSDLFSNGEARFGIRRLARDGIFTP